MTNRIIDLSPRQAALVSAIGLLIMTLFAAFSLFFVFPNLIVAGDAATTTNNIMANELQFRAGICVLAFV